MIWSIDFASQSSQNVAMNASEGKTQSEIIGIWAENNNSRLQMSMLQKSKNLADAEETSQQALLKAMTAHIPPEVLADGNKLSAWIFQTANRLVIDRNRKKYSGETSDAEHVSEIVTDAGDRPDDEQVYTEEWKRFRKCEEQLSDDERFVIWERLNGISHKQIANSKDWGSVNRSEKLQSSAKSKLTACMEGKK